MKKGWIKFHRKILDNAIFQNPELFQLFSYCLLMANHSEASFLWNGKEETLEKGSFITGRKAIARDLNQKESSVYKRLKTLEKLNTISVKSNNKFSIVKVLNYSIYQEEVTTGEQQSNNKVTSKEQQSNTNKNDKNVKNVRNNYAEFVSMTEEEHKKLIAEYGNEAVKKMIGILDNYKGSLGKKYKSDYRAILSWVVSEVKKTSPGIIQQTSIPDAEEIGNPFLKYKRRE